MKKLAYINDHRYYVCGGAVYSSGCMTKHVWERFLHSFDHVTVFSTLIPATAEKVANLARVDIPGVDFFHVDYVDTPADFLKNYIFIRKEFEKELPKYDAVVARVPGQYAFNATRFCVKQGIPLGIEVVGCPFDSYWNYGRIEGKLIAPLMYVSMHFAVKRAQYLVYVTKNFLQHRYPSKAIQINASNVDIPAPDQSTISARFARIRSKEDSLYRIGLMGSMGVRYKGHRELLLALAQIKDHLPPFVVEFVGPGDSAWCVDMAIRLGLRDNLSIVGKLQPGKQVVDWLDTIDLYVHPSLQEGLPRSLIEAMSRGCPALASSIAGTPELLDSIYLHPPGKFSVLADQILKVINNRDEQLKMAKKNRDVSQEYFSTVLGPKRNGFWSMFSNSLQRKSE